MLRLLKLVAIAISYLALTACVPTIISKKEAFPQMYQEKPVALLVLPPLNETTAADARDYYATTIAEPLSQKGYYVFPVEVVTNILRQDGITDSEMLLDVPPQRFAEHFGADAVLFITIKEWTTAYYVVGGHVKVAIAYDMKSTKTGETLWHYYDTLTIDTSGGNTGGGLGGLIAKAIVTAINTATTDYVPIARQVNNMALVSIPYGNYHPEHDKDAAMAAVMKEKMDVAAQAK